jgi:hypothetical protein
MKFGTRFAFTHFAKQTIKIIVKEKNKTKTPQEFLRRLEK